MAKIFKIKEIVGGSKKQKHEEAKQGVVIKGWAHVMRMENTDDFEITKKKFKKAVNKLSRRRKKSYEGQAKASRTQSVS